MVYRKDTVYQADLRVGSIFLLIVLSLILFGCDCTAGSDAISKTICTTDKE